VDVPNSINQLLKQEMHSVRQKKLTKELAKCQVGRT